MFTKSKPLAALALAGSLLTACAASVEAHPANYGYDYDYGPSQPGPATYRPAPVLAPGQVVYRLHQQGYRRVERVTYRPAVFWNGRGHHEHGLRHGAYIAEVDRGRRPDVYLLVNPYTGRVIREYHGRL